MLLKQYRTIEQMCSYTHSITLNVMLYILFFSEKDGTYDLYKIANKTANIEELSSQSESVEHVNDDTLGGYDNEESHEDENREVDFVREKSNRMGNCPPEINSTVDDRLPEHYQSNSHAQTSDRNVPTDITPMHNQELRSAIQNSLKSVHHMNFQGSSNGSSSNINSPPFSHLNSHSPSGSTRFSHSNLPGNLNPNVSSNLHANFTISSHSNLTGASNTRPATENRRHQQSTVAPRPVQSAVQQAMAMQNYGKHTHGAFDGNSAFESVKSVTADYIVESNRSVDNIRERIDHIEEQSGERLRQVYEQNTAMNKCTETLKGNTNRADDYLRDRPQTNGSSDNATNKRKDQLLSGEQLILPPPPKQHRTGFKLGKGFNQGHARVATAQATFPAGFDARLDAPKAPVQPAKSDARERHELLQLKPRHKAVSSESTVSKERTDDSASLGLVKVAEEAESVTKIPKCVPVQAKETAGKKMTDSHSSVNSLTYKGPVPKFIPRQAKAALDKKVTGSTKQRLKVTVNALSAEVNKELKKNALILGKRQGPIPLERGEKKKPNMAELSVNKSVQDIRKRLKDVT